MNDLQIVELYWRRSESAISETSLKYERFCHTIAYNILFSEEDSEECVNDTWLKAWYSIPPNKPSKLSAFLGRITRNLSLDRLRSRYALKRSGSEATLALDELAECIPARAGIEAAMEARELGGLLNGFLEEMEPVARKILIRRYWFLSPVKEIASAYGVSESSVKVTLHRTRVKLREYLEKEGVVL